MRRIITISAAIVLWANYGNLPAATMHPEVLSIDSSAGSPGDKIKLSGHHLKGTRSVRFVTGSILRECKFHIRSDDELELTVPECYHPKANALILLEHKSGVIITTPDAGVTSPQGVYDPMSVMCVEDGRAVPRGSRVTFVGANGTLGECSVHDSSLVFVKSGGQIGSIAQKNRPFPTLIFHEAGATFGPSFNKSSPYYLLIPVESVALARGVDRFVYVTKASDRGASTRPPKSRVRVLHDSREAQRPHITSVTPLMARPGDIITIHGNGFSGTSAVRTQPRESRADSEAFRVVSDREIRYQLPPVHIYGPATLMVVTPNGLACAQSSLATKDIHPYPALPNEMSRPFIHVRRGMMLTQYEIGAQSQVVFVDQGGTVTKTGAFPLLLVKAGGTVAQDGCEVFHEPGAHVASNPDSSPRITVVPHIDLSHLEADFQIIWPTRLRK